MKQDQLHLSSRNGLLLCGRPDLSFQRRFHYARDLAGHIIPNIVWTWCPRRRQEHVRADRPFTPKGEEKFPVFVDLSSR
jgi:hypothetical protein